VVRSLRRLGALVILSCAFALALGAGPALAAGPANEPAPRELWEEYPLEPLESQSPSESILTIRSPAAGESSSPDRLLLIGGLALFVLVLSDTVFLALSSRLVRGTP
jgi:hypothetical protein